MKITVITCTWNSARHLAESLASVLAQDYKDIEYIFVDGGSDDGTLDLIQALDRPYRLLRDVRGGVSRAMNAGIEAATGDVITHLHSDDYYLHPQVLSRIARCFGIDKAHWVVGRISILENGLLTSENNRKQGYSYRALASGRFYIPHPATFVARSIFEAGGYFDEQLKYAMDWDMWFRLVQLAPPLVLDEELAVFRVHDGSLSTANTASKLNARREELKVRFRYAHRAPLQTAIWFARYCVRTRRLKRALAQGL